MIARIKIRIAERINRFIALVKKEKGVMIGVICAAGLALLCSLLGDKSGFSAKLIEGSTNYFTHFLKVVFFTSLLYVVLPFTSVNRVTFLLNYLFVFFLTRYLFSKCFGCIEEGFSGVLFCFFYCLPLIAINVILFAVCLFTVYDNTCAGTGIRYFSPLRCTLKESFSLLKKYWIGSLIHNLCATALLFLLIRLL